LRRALEGEQFGYADGCRPIRDQRFSFPAINNSLTSGRACIFSISSSRMASAFAMIQPSARRDSGLIFAAAMVIPFVRQIDQPAGIAKNLL
jgi:hypothetical protein